MTIDWISIVTIIVTFITGGGVSALFFFKQEKRGKELDNEGKKVENASNLVAEYTNLLERYKAEIDQCKLELTDWKKQSEELTKRMYECERKQAVMQTELANTQLLYTTANAIKCTRLHCKFRTPPIDKEYLDKVAGINVDDTDDDSAKELTIDDNDNEGIN